MGIVTALATGIASSPSSGGMEAGTGVVLRRDCGLARCREVDSAPSLGNANVGTHEGIADPGSTLVQVGFA